MPPLNRWLVAGLIVALAAGLRFHKLGDWPFAGDETATLSEAASFAGLNDLSPDDQYYRLPRIVPLSYAVHAAGIRLFGATEFGSRVPMAVFGAATIGLVFVGLDRLRGRPAAVATALLMALWPDHLYQSQQARFYVVAGFFTTAAMLAGAAAGQGRSARWAAVAGLAAVAAVLAHTVAGAVLGLVGAGVLAAAVAERRPPRLGVLLALAAAGVVAVLIVVFHVRPLAAGWNPGSAWAYTIPEGLQSAAASIGWTVILLAALGVLLLLTERTAQNWYWLVCAAGYPAAVLTLPKVVAYHPSYAFPLALGVFVAAGHAVATICDLLAERHRLAAVAWIGLACMGNLPGVVSHYSDGSRMDYRTAAAAVRAGWRPGDRLAAYSRGLIRYYEPGLEPAAGLTYPDPTRELQALAAEPGRLWVVLHSGRRGIADDAARWLDRHARHVLRVRKPRFDYADYCVDVYLLDPAAKAAAQTGTSP